MLKEIKSAGILGVGAYIPEEIRTNEFWNDIPFANIPDPTKDAFRGIKERRVFPEDMLPSDAETQAGKNALLDAGISPDEIDLVMVHSMVQDEIIPSNASLVQYKLGLKNAGAWHIDSCCSSFVTMVVNAANLIATGEFKNILIITSVLHSKILDYSDYLSPFAGDAAAAVVMGVVPDERGYIASCCNSDGQYHNAFTIAYRMPYSQQTISHIGTSPMKNFMTTNPEVVKRVGRTSLEDMTEIIEKALKKAGKKGKEIDLFLSHQPCHWAHAAWRDAVGIKAENSYETYAKYGNVASSCIPVNLYEAKQKGMLKDGDYVLIASSGAGKNHIAAVLRWYQK